ncbi:hypothetical protein ABGB14_28730 [Nonomuraea sp. B10E15]
MRSAPERPAMVWRLPVLAAAMAPRRAVLMTAADDQIIPRDP